MVLSDIPIKTICNFPNNLLFTVTTLTFRKVVGIYVPIKYYNLFKYRII